MIILFCLCFISLLTGDASSEGIAPVSPKEFISEGKTITLSCSYNGSAGTDALHWYRQYPRSRPDFLFLVNEAKFKQPAEPPIPGISARLNEEKNHVDLEINGTALTDSALYYCALQPTVTGNTHTLYKNQTHSKWKLKSLFSVCAQWSGNIG
ncbi:T-cell receptor alpha chain V region PHDS58 [Anabarilius grahami]|nr:T-cell receptor alpha chain V region PHDS58 [Anabarilius grahami]